MRTFLLSLLSVCTITVSSAQQAWIPGDVLVMLNPGASAHAIARDLSMVDGRATNMQVVEELSAPLRIWHLHYENPAIPEPVMLRAVQAHPAAQLAQLNHIVKDRVVPNDTDYGSQWHHQNIDSEAAWDITTGGVTALGDTIVVCIIENVDLPHPDLIGNAWYNHQEIPDNGIDEDANGYVDDFEGWNPPGNNDNVYGGSHGTEVAGMIGATGNDAQGVSGANWDVKMMVVSRGSITESNVVQAYTYPLVMRRLYNQTGGNKGAFVVATNASWGIDNADPVDYPLWCAMYDSLGAEGVLNCGATANNDVDVDAVGDMPTACSSDYMISVTATNINDVRTFSGYGATTIDVGAPGAGVLTTEIGGGYGFSSGTSFASPLTAGVIGLLCSAPCANLATLMRQDPEAGALQLRQALFNGVEQVGNLPGNTVTGGRINAANSLQWIMGNCGSCPVPYDLSASSTELGQATLSWNTVVPATFTVQYRPVGDTTWTTFPGVVNNTLLISGLTDCTEYEFQVEADCDSITSGASQLFTWTSEGCCTAPLTLTAIAASATSAQVDWSTVLAAGTYDLRYAVSGTANWTTVTGLTGNSTVLTGLDSCTAYDLQITSSCNGSPAPWSPTVLFDTPGCGACLDNSYCPSTGDNSNSEWIANVTVGLINNTSGNDNGYGDFTGVSTALIIGQTYPLSLSPGFSNFLYNEWFKVYIDLDGDGQFQTSDLVFDAGSTNSTTVTGSITIPPGTLPSPSRMRVVMKFNGAPVDGCEDGYDYGETEDYCVTLTAAVGVQELGYAPVVQAYPVPADDVLYLDVTGTNGLMQVDVLDNSGRIVLSRILQPGRTAIPTTALAEGMYTFQLRQGGVRGRFVVLHGTR